MRAILSGLHHKKNLQELEFELIDVPEPFDDLMVTFLEKQTQATVTVPITRVVNSRVVRLRIDANDLQVPNSELSEFSWELYLNIQQDVTRGLIQVESEYLSDRHQLTLTSFYQLNSDANGMALFKLHTQQPAAEFTISAINLQDNQLQITGPNRLNNQRIEHQRLVLKNESAGSFAEWPIAKMGLHGLFSATIPLNELAANSTQELYIRSTFEGQDLDQRVVLGKSLAGQVTQTITDQHRLVVLEKRYNNGIRIREMAAPSLPQRLGHLPSKAGSATKLLSVLMEKVNLVYMRRLFKRGHRAYDQPTLIFESFGGRQVSDSPYAIYQLFTQLYPGFKFVWSIDRSQKKFCKQNGIPFVVRRTAKWVRTLEKATFWISNARFPAWVKKPSYVTYIQTWHGTPLKKLGLDIENVSMPGTTTVKYHANFVREANRWDALVSPNDYSTQIFRSAFGFNNQILKVGYPRNDELINSSPEDIVALKQAMGIPLDKKVVLYAPTYRDNQFAEKGKYTFELPFSLDDFKQKFGDDAVLVLRMHYLISNALDISGYEDFVYDLSNHPSISDLYLVSDMLITDYSSVFFDYAYLKRPILFYPYDYHMYKDELRGFYLDYEKDLPGDIAHDESELLTMIGEKLQTPDMSHNQKFMDFYHRFCAIDDGLSSLKVVNYVVQQIEKNG
ncbi:glycosyl glycerophosphate transferase [Levilactobacillus namurensis DSM 19117]|uniref:Glycosyl glycerophosphate transferase n=1 Tax=Levilactobacillus namurensis DSM 19117 TaxID=1423773 RepID=A0A0R1JZ75_9LACO|nr:CDP-glycerol glycerophosphotransferase family protein [Levilactobacillus namurensis]KRK73681.1 glycosyl glycerophosphate transferase [Levilactobacillus namurensis DSM 19117]GEO74920.1 CDP-glycerol:poly(glycerophosphate) glycerophosphotransferase [Levilactobacillus namurensis]HJE45636.1 CDP-glycerol glycerophosphotransferase family protein [Levilactobacillus namurensis]